MMTHARLGQSFMNLDKTRSGTTKKIGNGCAVNGLCKDYVPASPAGQRDTSPSVSIVVPCRNEAKAIDAFLNSLLNLEMGDINWEAIIADGMSDDGTRKVLEQFGKEHRQIRIIDNPSRIVSAGLNACIRTAAGDIILRMD